jgi:hypothetical protein
VDIGQNRVCMMGTQTLALARASVTQSEGAWLKLLSGDEQLKILRWEAEYEEMWRKFNDAQYHLQIVWRHGDSERLDAVVDVRRLVRKFLRIMEVVALDVESGPERFV